MNVTEWPHPYGIKTSQLWHQIYAHLERIQKYDVELFIELGVNEGGLTSVLIPRCAYDDKFSYLGVEKDISIVNSRVLSECQRFNHRAVVLNADMFSTVCMTVCVGLINSCKGPVMVFCDNGDKIKEFSVYSAFLRKGDFITVHDYGDEIGAVDVDSTATKYGLTELDPPHNRYWLAMPLFRKDLSQ